MMKLQSNMVWDGTNGPVQTDFTQVSGLSNLTIKNQAFNGGQLKFTDCPNLRLENLTFNGTGGQQNGRCVNLYGTLPNLLITKCSFTNCNGDSCVFCDHGVLVDAEVSWNKFVNVTHGVHFAIGLPYQRNDVKIFSNSFKGILKFALEMQNGFQGLDIYRNFCADFRAADSRMVFSIATGPSDNSTPASQQATYGKRVRVFDNFLTDDPARSTTNDTYLVCELMGADAQFFNNMAAGAFGAGVLYGWSTAAWKFFNNVLACRSATWAPYKAEDHGVRPLPENVFGNTYPVSIVRPNEQDVLNGNAFFQTTYGGKPVVVPSNTTAAALTAAQAGPGALTVSLQKVPAGAILHRRPTHATGTQYQWYPVCVVGIGDSTYKDTGLEPNWEYDYGIGYSGSYPATFITAQVSADPIPAVPSPVVGGIDYSELDAAYAALGAAISNLKK